MEFNKSKDLFEDSGDDDFSNASSDDYVPDTDDEKEAWREAERDKICHGDYIAEEGVGLPKDCHEGGEQVDENCNVIDKDGVLIANCYVTEEGEILLANCSVTEEGGEILLANCSATEEGGEILLANCSATEEDQTSGKTLTRKRKVR